MKNDGRKSSLFFVVGIDLKALAHVEFYMRRGVLCSAKNLFDLSFSPTSHAATFSSRYS